jgi:hypothetical protein
MYAACVHVHTDTLHELNALKRSAVEVRVQKGNEKTDMFLGRRHNFCVCGSLIFCEWLVGD